MYKEAGWTRLGRMKGYARANGRYTDPHGVPKDLHVFPLHRDTRSRMCAPDPLPDPLLPNPMGDASECGTSCNNDPLRGEILSKFAPPSGCRNSFSSGSDGKAARDDICIERNGMVRPAGWSGCGSSPTVLPSRRGGHYWAAKGGHF